MLKCALSNDTVTEQLSRFFVFASTSTDHQLVSTLSYILNGPLSVLVVLIGVSINLFTIVVFYRWTTRPAMCLYLIALSLWEILLLSSTFLLYILPTVYNRLRASYNYVIYASFSISHMALYGTVWTLIALIVDRYLALRLPLWHARTVTAVKVYITLVVVSFASLVVTVPRLFELEVITCAYRRHNNSGNASKNPTKMVMSLNRTEFSQTSLYMVGYKTIGGVVCYSLVPYVVLLFLMSRLLHYIRHKHQSSILSGRNFHRTGGETVIDSGSAFARSNRMFLVLIIKFLATHLLVTVLDVIETVFGAHSFVAKDVVTVLVDISNILVLLNGASHFVVYVLLSRAFQQQMRRSFHWLLDPVVQMLLPGSTLTTGGGPMPARVGALQRREAIRRHRRFSAQPQSRAPPPPPTQQQQQASIDFLTMHHGTPVHLAHSGLQLTVIRGKERSLSCSTIILPRDRAHPYGTFRDGDRVHY